jgi:hypothetical protein
MRLGICLSIFAAMIATPGAHANESALAAAQRAALWNAIHVSPKLKGVDQIVIEGDGAGQIVRGVLMKKAWLGPDLTDLQRPFWARIDRTCPDVRPGCFRVVGIWSGNELLAYISE